MLKHRESAALHPEVVNQNLQGDVVALLVEPLARPNLAEPVLLPQHCPPIRRPFCTGAPESVHEAGTPCAWQIVQVFEVRQHQQHKQLEPGTCLYASSRNSRLRRKIKLFLSSMTPLYHRGCVLQNLPQPEQLRVGKRAWFERLSKLRTGPAANLLSRGLLEVRINGRGLGFRGRNGRTWRIDAGFKLLKHVAVGLRLPFLSSIGRARGVHCSAQLFAKAGR